MFIFIYYFYSLWMFWVCLNYQLAKAKVFTYYPWLFPILRWNTTHLSENIWWWRNPTLNPNMHHHAPNIGGHSFAKSHSNANTHNFKHISHNFQKYTGEPIELSTMIQIHLECVWKMARWKELTIEEQSNDVTQPCWL